VGVLLLLALGLALTQIILWTSIPRDVVLSKLQTQLGLRIQAKSLSAGWLTTTLHDVRISLPLAEQSVVVVPEMRVRHNWLPLLLLQGPDLKSVELDRPVVNVWQSTDGRWNIGEVIELLGRSGGKDTDTARSTPASSIPPRLPNLVISDATVNIAAAGGKKQQIGHVEIRGQADGPLVWEYDISVAGRISLVGKVAPGDIWSHQVTVNVKPEAADLLRPWVANVPAFELVDGKWTGQLANGGLAGRLDVGMLKVNGLTASGALNASSENGTIQVRPVNFAMEIGQGPAAPRAVATGGSLTFDGKSLVANGVQATLAGGQLRMDGSVDTAVSGGKLSMLWEGLTLSPGGAAGGPRTSGSLEASFATRLAGRPEIRATLDTRGWLSATRNWDGKLQINGDGSSWQNIDWGITATSFALTGQQMVMLNGLHIALHMDKSELALTNMTLPESSASGGHELFQGVVANADNGLAVNEMISAGQFAPTTAPSTSGQTQGAIARPTVLARPGATTLRTLTGSGDFNFATQAWWLKLSGQGWPVPEIEDEPLGFNVDAQGSRDVLKLNDLSFYLAGAVARVTGTYVYAEPAPVHMQLDLTHKRAAPQKNSLQAERIQAVAAVTGVAPAVLPDADLINGDIQGTVMLTGRMKDGLDLNIKGKLMGRDVRLRGHKVGDFDGKIDGKANDLLAKVYTDKFDLLGAKWGLTGFYQFDTGTTTLTLSVDRLRLEDRRVRALLQREDLAGDFNGQWTLYMPGIKSRSERMSGNGWLEGTNLAAPSFAASDLHANFQLKDGNLSIDPIELRRPAVEIAGKVIPDAFKAALASTTAPFESDSQTAEKVDSSDGRIRFGVLMNLTDPDHITVSKLSFANWPFVMPGGGAALSVNGGGDTITIDLPDDNANPGSARGLFHLNSRSVGVTASILTYLTNGKAAKIGDCVVDVQLEDRVADVRDLHVNFLDATVNANALIDLDHPLLASARLWARNVDFKKIAAVFPAAGRVQGQYDLTVGIAPATNPHALEPLQIDVALHSVGARVGDMALGDGRLRAYANVDPQWGLVRLVSEDEPYSKAAHGPTKCPPLRDNPAMPNQNTIEMAGGMLRVWARFVRNQDEAGINGATSLSSQICLAFNCLELNQLAHIVDVQSPAMPGKLNGTIGLYGTTAIKMPKGAPLGTDPFAQAGARSAVQDPFMVRLGRSLYGDGNIALDDADIGNFGPIAFLYNAMHVGTDKRGPTGTGDVAFRVDGGALVVTALHYFNRGVEVRAQARVDNLAIIPDSPLTGTAVGIARPLKNLKLPIFSSVLPEVDQLLTALEGSAVSERIGGTLHAPKMSIILFGDIGQGMHDLLRGDVQAQAQNSTGQ
jgi:hypothetical protein